MVQGLAALAVHEPGRQAVDDGYTMARAAGGARHGTVRVATETALTWAGTCEPGNGLGIAGDEVLIVAPDVASAATGLIDLLLGAGGELITVLDRRRHRRGRPSSPRSARTFTTTTREASSRSIGPGTAATRC